MNKIRSRSSLALALAAIVAVFLLYWLTRTREPRVDAVSSTAPPADTRAEYEEPSSIESAPAASRDEAPARTELAPAPAPEPEPAPAAAPARPTADLAAREWIGFHVINKGGLPVPGAEIELTGMRTKRERGSWYGWRTEQSLGKTGADGNLRLAYPVWVSLDDETGEITFTVQHPDYVTFREDGRAVAPTMEVVLELGSVLVVSGWTDSPSEVVTDVRAHFSWDVDVKENDWLPRRDGRLTTTRVPPGNHLIYLEHESAARGLCFSAMTEFTLEAGDTQELHLQLEPARSVIGRLDDAVPRPIVDGHVVLALQMRATQEPTLRASLLWTSSAAVREDGSFAIERVGVGEGQIVALCKGWASKPERFSETTSSAGSEPAVDSSELIPQRIDLRAAMDELVVAMEPTAVFEVELRLPGGSPLAGARVTAWPNACWVVRACGMFIDDREWVALSDARGVARIEDIPAGHHGFGVQHHEYDLPFDSSPSSSNRDRTRYEQFESGAILRRTYTVERTKGD